MFRAVELVNCKDIYGSFSPTLILYTKAQVLEDPTNYSILQALWSWKSDTTFHPHHCPILPTLPPTWEEGRPCGGYSWVELLPFPWRQWRLSLLGDYEIAAIVKFWRVDSGLFSCEGWSWVTIAHPQEEAGWIPEMSELGTQWTLTVNWRLLWPPPSWVRVCCTCDIHGADH